MTKNVKTEKEYRDIMTRFERFAAETREISTDKLSFNLNDCGEILKQVLNL